MHSSRCPRGKAGTYYCSSDVALRSAMRSQPWPQETELELGSARAAAFPLRVVPARRTKKGGVPCQAALSSGRLMVSQKRGGRSHPAECLITEGSSPDQDRYAGEPNKGFTHQY
ncbi:hypothetical protein NDU88_005223 [Pleurodeles waltl]|uniref:Uncharacterized protein n=1 Tax=Pleurodeles waltl TaxID=8319 RepID=A0AAV7ULG5_PLEWA|nr:hypothetical protein NDU88_005223 [Pleurodeles waltl]